MNSIDIPLSRFMFLPIVIINIYVVQLYKKKNLVSERIFAARFENWVDNVSKIYNFSINSTQESSSQIEVRSRC